jgi:hypothetical protein
LNWGAQEQTLAGYKPTARWTASKTKLLYFETTTFMQNFGCPTHIVKLHRTCKSGNFALVLGVILFPFFSHPALYPFFCPFLLFCFSSSRSIFSHEMIAIKITARST